MRFILQRLRGTPVNRPELSGGGLRRDGHLHVSELLPLPVVRVTGGSAKNDSDQQEAPKGNESNVGRDGAGGRKDKATERRKEGLKRKR